MRTRLARSPRSIAALVALLAVAIFSPARTYAKAPKQIHKKISDSSTAKSAAQSLLQPPEPSFDFSEAGPLYRSADSIAHGFKDNESEFTQTSLETVHSVSAFAEAYPDYYFRLVKENEPALASIEKLENFSAWCPGRALPESFGALIRGDAASIFSVSDVDTAGTCPLALSFMQLLMGSSFYDSHLRVDLMLNSYVKGLQGDELEIPHLAEDLLARSRSNGMVPDEARAFGDHLLREPNSRELNEREREVIQANLDQFFPRKVRILDALKTRGESALGKIQDRVALLLESRGQVLVVDLKEEIPSATSAFASGESLSLSDRLTTAFTIERGGLSIYEGAIQIAGVKYTMMPNFRGDLLVQLGPDSRDEETEVADLLQFEAYTLGQIHSRTLNEPQAYVKAWAAVDVQNLARDVQALNLFYTRKFNSLQQVSPSLAAVGAEASPASPANPVAP